MFTCNMESNQYSYEQMWAVLPNGTFKSPDFVRPVPSGQLWEYIRLKGYENIKNMVTEVVSMCQTRYFSTFKGMESFLLAYIMFWEFNKEWDFKAGCWFDSDTELKGEVLMSTTEVYERKAVFSHQHMQGMGFRYLLHVDGNQFFVDSALGAYFDRLYRSLGYKVEGFNG